MPDELGDWLPNDVFDHAGAGLFPEQLQGPKGIAAVQVYDEGRTSPGWGLISPRGGPAFMENYRHGRFSYRKAAWALENRSQAFAFVMRSMRVVCLDLDHHSEDGPDGIDNAIDEMPWLPPTLAESSKGGDGRHLFYSVDETWDDLLGFGRYADRIGFIDGVDLRSVGCVYHYPTQRWNGRPIVPAPKELVQRLEQKRELASLVRNNIADIVSAGDEEEVLMLQTELEDELSGPIAPGKRNNTLFAIGSKMKNAQVPDWEKKVSARATDLGLDAAECAKLIGNIDRYGI